MHLSLPENHIFSNLRSNIDIFHLNFVHFVFKTSSYFESLYWIKCLREVAPGDIEFTQSEIKSHHFFKTEK